AARQAVTLGPDEAWTHNFLGEAYLIVGKYDSALAEFRQLDVLGMPWLTAEKLALVEIYQGKYASALNILQEKESKVNKRAESTLYWLNGQKERAGEFWLASDTDLSRVGWRAAKRGADAFVADSLLRMAIAREHYKGNIKEALNLCDRAADEIVHKDLGGSYTQVLLANRAEILHGAGRYSEAAQVYETLVKEDPRTFYTYRLADCYYRQKRYLDARDLLLQVKFSNESLAWIGIYFAYSYPKSIYLLGLVHEALGERAEAVQAYQRFLGLWKNADKDLPELSNAKSRLAELQ
ncbi:tetratricopeptide repeat protein, partial [candidate division KSB1 bacterium]|nr:tetratricopeptide repeat protein [candidate division KSB1 bacterium]